MSIQTVLETETRNRRLVNENVDVHQMIVDAAKSCKIGSGARGGVEKVI